MCVCLCGVGIGVDSIGVIIRNYVRMCVCVCMCTCALVDLNNRFVDGRKESPDLGISRRKIKSQLLIWVSWYGPRPSSHSSKMILFSSFVQTLGFFCFNIYTLLCTAWHLG